MSKSDKRISRSYPLSTLFLLVTACAAMAAMIALLARRERSEIGVGDAVVASVQWGITFLAVGTIVGCFHARRLRGMLWGALSGLILGLLAGPAMLLPSSQLPVVLLTSMAGAAALLAVSATIRLTTKYDHTDPNATEQTNGAGKAEPHPLDPDTSDDSS